MKGLVKCTVETKSMEHQGNRGQGLSRGEFNANNHKNCIVVLGAVKICSGKLLYKSLQLIKTSCTVTDW